MKTNRGIRLHSKRVYKPQSPKPEILTVEINGNKISWIHHPELDGDPASLLPIPSKPAEGKYDFDLLYPYIVGSGKNFGEIIIVTNTYLHTGSMVALDEDGAPIIAIRSCTPKVDFFEIIYVCTASVVSNDPNEGIKGTAKKARYMFSSRGENS